MTINLTLKPSSKLASKIRNLKETCPVCLDAEISSSNNFVCDKCNNSICDKCYHTMLDDLHNTYPEHNYDLPCVFYCGGFY